MSYNPKTGLAYSQHSYSPAYDYRVLGDAEEPKKLATTADLSPGIRSLRRSAGTSTNR